MSDVVHVRDADTEDLAACAQLNAERHSDLVELWYERFENDLHNPLRRFLVATINDRVIGYGHTVEHVREGGDVDASPSGYFLAGLLVSPHYRRTGVGTRLTTARLNILRNQTDVVYYLADPLNRATIEMHSRLGFTTVGPVMRQGKQFILYECERRDGAVQVVV